MKFGLYISDILFNIGGTEAYCAYICYALQQIYNYPEIKVVSEKYKDTKIDEFNIVSRFNSCFGMSIKDKNVQLELVHADKVNFIKRAIFEHRLKKASKKFDVFINVSMNLFTFAAKSNFVIIHFPQYRKTKSTFVKKYPFMLFFAWLKDLYFLYNYDLYITNSQFTKYWLDKIWHIEGKKTALVYPAVSPINRLIEFKSNFIIVCSRIEKSKQIDILISAFLSSETLKKYFKLIIAGAIIEEHMQYINYIRSMVKNCSSIIFHENPSRNEIENYYCNSKIFWHAKGYGVNEEIDPYEMEHFGITTVEAMSAGCVPVVINKGGQKEIVENGVNGFLWDTPEQLIERTIYLSQHDDERQILAERAVEKAKKYSLENFTKNLGEALTKTIKMV
jgi:glycosyltransferase involved in cell wall biosynthesis